MPENSEPEMTTTSCDNTVNPVGPLLLFDKSLLHVLIPAEIEELSRSFYLVGSPTLMGETSRNR